MEEMSVDSYVDSILSRVRPDKIDLGEYDDPYIAFVLWDGTIFINSRCPEEEKVKSLLHEAIHLDREFIVYTRSLWTGKRRRDEVIERRIETIAQRIYEQRPDVVDTLRARLEACLRDPRNLSSSYIDSPKWRENVKPASLQPERL